MQLSKSTSLAFHTPSNCSTVSTDHSSLSSSPLDFFCDESLDLDLLSSQTTAKKPPPISTRSQIEAYQSELQFKTDTYQLDGSLIFENQTEIKPALRAILFDWILELSEQFKLQRETFYRTMYYLDKYMMIQPCIKRDNFQLLGMSCLWIAVKTEEVNGIRIQNLLEMTGNVYTESQVKETERDLVIKLGWKLCPPTLNGWMNVIINLWDMYIARSRYEEIRKLNILSDYETYKEIMDRLDALNFDLRSLVFSSKKLTSALVYAVLQSKLQNSLKRLKAEKRAPLQTIEFSRITQKLDHTFILYKKFSKFLIRERLCKFQELTKEMSYVSCFMDLEINYNSDFKNEEYFKASHSEEKLKFVMARIRRQCKSVM